MVDKKIQNFVSDLGIMSRTETRTTGILAAAGGLKLIVGGVTKIGIVTGVGASLGPIMIPLTLMMG
jgi:hypothetical protein